jgi:hypothetical protein
MAEFIKDYTSCHWYDRAGKPVFEVMGKTGKMIRTTVKHAREQGLLPSVTTILGILAKPELEIWKQEQVLLASLTLPKIDGEDDKSYIKRIIEDSKAQSEVAIGFGKAVHTYCEGIVKRENVPQEVIDLIPEKTREAIKDLFKTFEEVIYSEKSLANSHFAGTLDLLIKKDGKLYLPDIKTQGTTEGKPFRVYDTWEYQMSAYRRLAIDNNIIPFDSELHSAVIAVSSKEEGRVEWIDVEKQRIDKGWRVFESLMKTYYMIKEL